MNKAGSRQCGFPDWFLLCLYCQAD